MRASARFSRGARPLETGAEAEVAAEVKAAKVQRDNVRNLIQRVADEADALEERMKQAAAGGDALPAVRRARALRSFVSMRDGEPVSEVAADDVVVLVDADPASRWWTGHLEGGAGETAGEFLQKFVQVSSPRTQKPTPPALAFCMSWCADFAFRGTHRRSKVTSSWTLTTTSTPRPRPGWTDCRLVVAYSCDPY